MQIDPTFWYRVRAVARGFDVSVATIYRAVERGELRAIRIGTGKGAVRIPGDALIEYKAACERAAITRATTPTESAPTTMTASARTGGAA